MVAWELFVIRPELFNRKPMKIQAQRACKTQPRVADRLPWGDKDRIDSTLKGSRNAEQSIDLRDPFRVDSHTGSNTQGSLMATLG
jgi:hypothetical protein